MSNQRVTRTNKNAELVQLGNTAFGTDSEVPHYQNPDSDVVDPFKVNNSINRSPPSYSNQSQNNNSRSSSNSIASSPVNTDTFSRPNSPELHQGNSNSLELELFSRSSSSTEPDRLDFNQLEKSLDSILDETMAAISYSDIKDLIPRYKGEPSKLEEVIQTNDSIYAQLDKDIDKKLFNLTVKTRMTEKAFDAIKTVADTSTWPKIKEALKLKISPINSQCSYTQLTRARQYNGESIGDYASRVETLLTNLNRSTATTDNTINAHVEKTNGQLAKRTFEFGLINREIRTILLAKTTESLNESIETAVELDSYGEFSNNSQSNIPNKQKYVAKQTPTKSCNFCNKKGHVEGECYSKLNKIGKNGPKPTSQVGALFCNYCKETDHEIGNCSKRPKNRNFDKPKNTRKFRQENNPEERSEGEGFTLEEIAEFQSKNE